MRAILIASVLLAAPVPVLAQDPEDTLELPSVVMSTEFPGEIEVEPYARANANAGTTPFEGTEMWEAFGTEDGVSALVDTFVDLIIADPRIAGIFVAQDEVRLRRTLKEQFSYILGGPVDYSGRDMRSSHADLGIQSADMGALVENLQIAMSRHSLPFRVQNRFLAKLAPMRRDIVTR
ncbi:group 1 truncated hemoglobin [Brevundimonas sp.]|jgi:hemoglobin|uniref:group I truncated hemoglobin n=1 Tax=Brevundimonas sp. TaxID=1871086 RepID=UPI002639E78D|nr:group 1 truncated hemoglobin [Brevundimonas sp.]